MWSKLAAAALLSLLIATAAQVAANCEHVHFHAPHAITSRSELRRGRLQLNILTPETPTVRTTLHPKFTEPPRQAALGAPTWLLLDELVVSRHYETRACYAAIQPTAIQLEVFDLEIVRDTPELFDSLVEFACLLRPETSHDQVQLEVGAFLASEASDSLSPGQADDLQHSSALLLRILAAAEYFTHDEKLMANVPPTHVDIILDPWVYGIAPRTALPLIAYSVAVACVAFPLGLYVASRLQTLILAVEEDDVKKDA